MRQLSKDGTAIAYSRAGDGPPLILIDGALCHRAAGPNRRLAERLSREFTVVTYDRRGRGESGDTAPYAVEREIEDIEALVEAAGGPVCVYGISSGAALALEAAVRMPAIERLALYEAPFIVDDSRAPIALRYEGLSRAAAVRAFLRAVGVPRPFAALMSHMGKLKAVAHTLPYDAAIVGPHQLGKPLPRWDVPADTVVIAGGKSRTWMKNANRALAEATGAEFRMLEGSNHMVKAKAVAPLLAAHFAARHPERA